MDCTKNVLWQWHDIAGKYFDYGENENQRIASAKSQQVSIKLNNPLRTYTLDLKLMTQRNDATGFERELRCGVCDTSNQSVCYFWMSRGNNNELKGLKREVCETLEDKFNADVKSFTFDGISYDLTRMKSQRAGSSDELELIRMKYHKPGSDDTNGTTPAMEVNDDQVDGKSGVRRSQRVRNVKSNAVATSSTSAASHDNNTKGSGRRKRQVKIEEEDEDDKGDKKLDKTVDKKNKTDDKKPNDSITKKGSITEEIEEKKLKLSKSVGMKSSGINNKPNSNNNGKISANSATTSDVKVDSECSIARASKVYIDNGEVFDATLNQTNIDNNNNKYYIMQLLESTASKQYHVWFRWGRVGYKGQNSLFPCGSDINRAKKLFTDKFLVKTKNDWSRRSNFKHFHGKYDLVDVDYSAGDDNDQKDSVDSKKVKVEPLPCELDKKVQDLISLICDKNLFESSVKEMQFDIKKNPLGKLTEEQIRSGYEALQDIATLIEGGGTSGTSLKHACNAFYTRIPHYFGMRVPHVIRTPQDIKNKIELLEALTNIQMVVDKLAGDNDAGGEQGMEKPKHPVTRNYEFLDCDITPIPGNTDEYKLVDKYLQQTHAPTHNTYKMVLKEIYQVKKPREEGRFQDVGNKMLLWHGSRLTNFAGILSKGLQIAPPEAPVTGYMFGKGIYFADRSSKSANYCFTSASKKTGLMLLYEVSLGTCNELNLAKYDANKLPSGTHSTMGRGIMVPAENELEKLGDVTVPLGKTVRRQAKPGEVVQLQYNEYCIYNTKQIKMKYLLKVDFEFAI